MDAKETTLPPTGSHRSLWRSLHIQTWVQTLGSTCDASEVCSVQHTPFTKSLSFGQTPPTANTHNLSSLNISIQDLHAPSYPDTHLGLYGALGSPQKTLVTLLE